MTTHPITVSNWARNISCTPCEVLQPASVEEVITIVRRAAAAGRRIAVRGAGHSWSPLVQTEDILVNLDRLADIILVDAARRQVTVQAGIRIKDLVQALYRAGLGMKNLGSIMEQSIAGAISTGTHGTGIGLGCLHTAVVGMKMVTADGNVRTLSRDHDPDIFRAALVSLGALGIIVELTLQCVPFYNVEHRAWPMRYTEFVDRLDEIVQTHERVRIYWLSGIDDVYVNTLNATEAPLSKVSPYARWFRDRVLRHGLLSVLMKLSHCAPRLIGPINRFEARVGYERFAQVGPYFAEIPIGLSPPHYECEYAVPLDRARDAIEANRRILASLDNRINLPSEFRFVRADDAMLSPVYGTDGCYLCAQTGGADFARDYFARFEPAMKALGGRPHWGKMFSLTPEEAARIYPDYHRFVEIRHRLDPTNMFANAVIQTVFP